MSKVKNLNERLQPLKKVLEAANYDEERLIVSEHRFVHDGLILTISDKYTGQESHVTLSPDEVTDFTDEFFKLIQFTDSPNYWYLKDFANGVFRAKVFKEIKDILLARVNPMFESIKILEVA